MNKKFPAKNLFSLRHETAVKNLEAYDSLKNTDSSNAQSYLDKAEDIIALINNFYTYANSGNNYYAIYGSSIDSLKQVAIVSAVQSMELNPSSRNKMRGLKLLAYIYNNDGDTLYSNRTVKALINLNYRFPYYAHGFMLGLNFGANPTLDLNYTIGQFSPGNRLVHEYPRYGGATIGYELNPQSPYGGFKIGGIYNVWPFTLGTHLIIYGSASYKDSSMVNGKSTAVTAYAFRPEVGFAWGSFHFLVGYNLLGGNNSQAGNHTYTGVRGNINTWNFAIRGSLLAPLQRKKSNFEQAILEAGLKRKH